MDDAIQETIEYIAREQCADGSFASVSSAQRDDFRGGIPYSTTFFTSVILGCLPKTLPKSDRLQDIRKRGIQFLLAQKSPAWSWNYWERTSKEYKSLPYPDDLDDTFAALIAIAKCDSTLINGEVLARTAKLLTSLEIVAGGPYRTWIVNKEANQQWQDVDLVVNSTIGYFLSLIGVRLPLLEKYIGNAIKENHSDSPYYPGTLHCAYFASRLYKGLRRGQLANIIIRAKESAAEKMNTLEKAMAITALINLGRTKEIQPEEIASLNATLKNGTWKPYAFCIDPMRNGQQHYAGSSALTAAFCVEALTRYQAVACAQPIEPVPKETLRAGQFHKHIQELARNECSHIPPALKLVAFREIEKMKSETVTGIVHDFHNVLQTKNKIITKTTFESIALASLYGWIAYTIYDDFLDGAGDPILLSCAHFFLRMLTRIYGELAQNIPGVFNLFNSAMNALDAANIWEQEHCTRPAEPPRFGNYTNLADRSFGHALGPLVQVLHAGYKENSPEFKAASAFFRHYLIARQLHDDAHDWADDLERGRVNSVSALVLRRSKMQFPHEIHHLRLLFWKEAVDSVVGLILHHIKISRQRREDCSLLAGTSFMENELSALESAARRTLAERDQALVFLQSYLI